MLQIALPIGISFYTFHALSYTIDVYRGTAPPGRSLVDFACYIALFPQLVAGPIIRYNTVAEQLVSRSHTWEKFSSGVALFILGLAKKILLADPMGRIADAAFDADALAAPDAWFGAVAYAFQIYFDFSGYSDMAVGLGRMIGFEFMKNFDSPYQADSITDFWRRWHISLSTFLRDYLYIPLGGNRRGPGSNLCEPVHRYAAGRSVARCQLDVRRLGRVSRGDPGAGAVSRPATPVPIAAAPGARAHDLHPRALLLGLVPRQ